jgi:putative FmdB family regulatory protein
MPTYEYECRSCGRRFDVVHGIHATRPTICEHCGGELRKTMSTPAIHFKGSGWAKKDARGGLPSTGKGASVDSDAAIDAHADAGSGKRSKSSAGSSSSASSTSSTDSSKGTSTPASGASSAE